MSVLGKLRRVVLKIAEAKIGPKDKRDDDERFHKPGRVSRHIEDGKDYQSIKFDEAAINIDLHPDKNERVILPTELKYVLILEFGTPIPKP